jgi:MscS family membrane protein
VQEDILLRFAEIVEKAGTGFAFPSSTTYYTRDRGLNAEQQQAAEKQVREWASAHALPLPDPTEEHRKWITNTLDYPPEGSPNTDRG